MALLDIEQDAFEQGFSAFQSFTNCPKLFPAVPINPHDPAQWLSLYDEWEAGYEYCFHLSKLPENQ